MRIGELSKATGASTRSLRYYEQQGLLRSHRQPNGYRDYPPSAVDDVAFVQDLYSAGLPSEIIKDIIPCARQEQPQGDCTALMVRVRNVRDELVRQEHRIAERRKTLDRYLTRSSAPRGVETAPAAD
jgi:DNA-binding transcriptional MerR regulator